MALRSLFKSKEEASNAGAQEVAVRTPLIPRHDHNKIITDATSQNDNEFPVYVCSKPTYETLKNVSLGDMLGIIDTDNSKNIESHDIMDTPELKLFVWEEAVREYGEDILVLNYTTLRDIKPEEVRAEIYAKSREPLTPYETKPRFLSLDELTLGTAGDGIPVFRKDLRTIQALTGKRFVSPTKGICGIKTNTHPRKREILTDYYNNSEVEAAKALFKQAQQTFSEDCIIVDFKPYRHLIRGFEPDIEKARYAYRATGVVVRPAQA